YTRLLQFKQKTNGRFLTALTSIGGSKTCKFTATDEQISKKYAGIAKASSPDTVQRDREKLLEEERQLDVSLIGFESFSFNPVLQKSPPSSYQNHLLRQSLEAINIYFNENPKDKFVDRVKLEEICKRRLSEFPKPKPKRRQNNFRKR